jgi:hypothetical protein
MAKRPRNEGAEEPSITTLNSEQESYVDEEDEEDWDEEDEEYWALWRIGKKRRMFKGPKERAMAAYNWAGVDMYLDAEKILLDEAMGRWISAMQRYGMDIEMLRDTLEPDESSVSLLCFRICDKYEKRYPALLGGGYDTSKWIGLFGNYKYHAGLEARRIATVSHAQRLYTEDPDHPAWEGVLVKEKIC